MKVVFDEAAHVSQEGGQAGHGLCLPDLACHGITAIAAGFETSLMQSGLRVDLHLGRNLYYCSRSFLVASGNASTVHIGLVWFRMSHKLEIVSEIPRSSRAMVKMNHGILMNCIQ